MKFSRSAFHALSCTLYCFVALPVAGTAGLVTLSNPASITINDSANPPTLAAPYGSSINVTGLVGQVVSKATVSLSGFTHQYPDDVDVLLVGPQGQTAMLMANVGGSMPGYSVTNLTLTLDDDAVSPLPLEAPLTSGIFKPTKRLPYLMFDFPTPAPAGSSNAFASLSVFQAANPNGPWKLYVVDDTSTDSGSISGGWSLSLTTIPVLLRITGADDSIIVSWTNTLTGFSLQTSTDLSPGAIWTNALPLPALVSGNYTVTNAATGSTRFYRLTK